MRECNHQYIANICRNLGNNRPAFGHFGSEQCVSQLNIAFMRWLLLASGENCGTKAASRNNCSL